MISIASVPDIRAFCRRAKAEGKTVGLVPTMGFLHEGHLSLVRESKKRADVTVVTIFVNPAQFGPKEDFQKYPRDFAKDTALLEAEGVDVVFHPAADDMYPPGYATFVEVHHLQDRMCGKSRPGHFRGVATIVLKLFNIVGPDLAFFGWKDAQQVILLKKMAEDLNCGVEIVACPLVREPDSLAMSSRNSYLSPEERRAALVLSQSLAEGERLIASGERTPGRIEGAIRAIIGREPRARIEYIETVNQSNLKPLLRIEGEVLVALAVFIGTTRLIDNIRVSV